ncbi:hypothetical protein ERC79_08395 [Rhodococcus sp. ABRD24]|uniref:hypothetical protein n=1 Tax=Rhodococcus sp. ABRD24 TaxID=2507582 RepID=UPI0010405612|nr:hypothetical protein [Rhodococcus sp. ABRD24]QBJ95990.1 hypothetical protein ERC79_08395 [Rhodococcus sp. ABRD24]
MKGNSKAGGIAILIVLGLVFAYWKWIVGFAAVCLVIWGAYAGITTAVRKHQEQTAKRQAENAALSARADEQHQEYLAGKDDGLYGDYQPASLD